MTLSEAQIKAAKPKDKEYLLNDGQGLNLLVKTNGKKYWRLRYWSGGKERRVSLGVYPVVSLKEAREKRFELAKLKDKGVDPSEAIRIKQDEAALSFEAIAREWVDTQLRGIRTDEHVDSIVSALQRFIFPSIGNKDIQQITAPEILSALRAIERQDKVYTAHRVSGSCSRIFRYAIATGRAERDPVADLRGALKPHKGEHRSAIIEVEKIRQLLRAMRDFDGTEVVKAAMWFSAYTFCRPGEIRRCEWREIDIKEAEWRIPSWKMKLRRVHIVPLATQAIELLERLQPLTGRCQYVFPSLRSKNGTVPMSENTVLYAIRRMGFGPDEMTAHGFRGMASTRLNEMGWPSIVIERQLSHMDNDQVRAAYNHAEYLSERKKMMQVWADWLDGLLKEDE